MFQGEKLYEFSITEKNQNQHIVSITLEPDKIDQLYKNALVMQKNQASTYGFSRGETPVQYIETAYKPNILEHLKDLLFTHCAVNFLCESLSKNKIVIAGDPKLVDVILEPQQNAKFLFNLYKVGDINDDKWKKISIKIAQRKNYKDIDKQVEHFIKEELDNKTNYSMEGINYGDWVLFSMQLVNELNEPVLNGYYDKLWVKISEEETDRDLHEIFINKKIGESFISSASYFQDYVNNNFGLNYRFKITIEDFINNAYFCFTLFKKHFQLKTEKELHLKLIEVFSFRNDISQRRETVENTLKSLIRQYYIPLPTYLLERQKQIVLAAVHMNPDYYVYKAQKDFKEKVKLLAEKQLREAIIIDAIAYQENINVLDQDIRAYLNLMNRARTRDFVYFKFPPTKSNSREMPLPNEIIKQYCLREKALNYVINFQNKKKQQIK